MLWFSYGELRYHLKFSVLASLPGSGGNGSHWAKSGMTLPTMMGSI
jgi:hypothetical protein